MTETQAIVDAYRRAAAEHVRAALVTVVGVAGSAYRQPGARMLVTETGHTTGVVSGGCLDGDIRERAANVMAAGLPACVTYDATMDEDLVWGLGTGCNGIVRVLIEPASPRTDHLVQFLDACSRGHHRAACATVIRSDNADLPLAARVFRYPDGHIAFDTAARRDAITPRILTGLQTAAHSGDSFVDYDGGGDAVDVFIEAIEPQVPLVIFGAGADVTPLVAMARQLGWHATVVDTHARDRSRERFAHADDVILCRPDEIAARVPLSASTVAVVMTHNYLHDVDVLNVLVHRPLRYVGCLGPKGRTERMLSHLRGAPAAWQTPLRSLPHAPVGMDIGAEAPAEIALSIAAEILAVLRGRSGGPLHRRAGSIHGNADVMVAVPHGGSAVCSREGS